MLGFVCSGVMCSLWNLVVVGLFFGYSVCVEKWLFELMMCDVCLVVRCLKLFIVWCCRNVVIDIFSVVVIL